MDAQIKTASLDKENPVSQQLPKKLTTASKGSTRKTLRTLQPTASRGTQLTLRAADGLIRIAEDKDSRKKAAIRVFEDEDDASKPVATKSVSVQTDLSSSSCSQLEHAEDIAWMYTMTGDALQMKKLAEQRGEALRDSLKENEELWKRNMELQDENEQLKQQNESLKELVEQAQDILALVKPLTSSDEDHDQEKAAAADDIRP